jgi:hypothetical protein
MKRRGPIGIRHCLSQYNCVISISQDVYCKGYRYNGIWAYNEKWLVLVACPHLAVTSEVAGISFDSTSCQNLCLRESGLFVGLVLEDLDMSLGLDDSASSGNEGPILRQKHQDRPP